MAANVDNHSDPQSSQPACAACRYQRKKCASNCILRRHFPASNNEGFAAVHRVFGVANVIKMMREVNSLADQDELARSLYWEASAWARDPVRGPYGAFALLQDEIRVLREQLNRHRMVLMQQNPSMLQESPPLPLNINSNNNYGNMAPRLPPPTLHNYNTSRNSNNVAVGSENYYINQPMPLSLSFDRQFNGIKEDYDRARVSLNGPESNIRVTANNLSWQQHYTSPPRHEDYKMR